MVKRTKIKSKDDITWIKPETKKINKVAAKCAQNKEKTSDLIKLHEKKIKDVVKNKKDELKGIKLTLKTNKPPNFQNMNTHHCGPEEKASPMILIIDGGSRWRTLSTVPPSREKSNGPTLTPGGLMKQSHQSLPSDQR